MFTVARPPIREVDFTDKIQVARQWAAHRFLSARRLANQGHYFLAGRMVGEALQKLAEAPHHPRELGHYAQGLRIETMVSNQAIRRQVRGG